MSQVIRIKRSKTRGKRVLPSSLQEGELFLNLHSDTPGVFFKDNAPVPGLRKVGSAHVGAEPPNSNPVSDNEFGHSQGELWYVENPNDVNHGNLLIFVGNEWKPVVSFVSQI
jgi:hypothetical protein